MMMRITLKQPQDDKSSGHSRPFTVDATVGETKDDQILHIMLAEVADLTKAMRELLMTADRFINFSGLIAVGALTLGVIKHDQGKNWLVLVLAPYGLAITFGYLIQTYTEVEKRAGYKRFLESRINHLMAKPVLLESQINSRHERNSKSVIGMQALNAMGFFGLLFMSGKETYHRYSHQGPGVWGIHLLNLNGLNCALLALSVAILSLTIWENSQASDSAYERAAKIAGYTLPSSEHGHTAPSTEGLDRGPQPVPHKGG